MNWALIAGGSKGLGFSIAQSLASRNYNIFLIARNTDDLAKAETQLKDSFNIQVEILSCDLSLPESAKIIFDYCIHKNLSINILCNAAGLGGSKDFQELPLADLATMIRTNIDSAVSMCFLFIPMLAKSAPSYILNIGSMAGFAPIPIKSVYASTKSALHFFSYSLRQITREQNISVSCACPGPVFTKASIEAETIHQLGWLGKKMSLQSDEAGELIVRGMFKRKMIIVPGKLATIVAFFLRFLPNPFIARIIYRVSERRDDS